jgi:ABC-type transport system involved in multi-copper enzyme maturation permease subunit
MKDAKQITRGFAPCFFAISAERLLNASMCGSAILFASSYVIAPWQSHILMFFRLITAGLIVFSLCFDFTAGHFILQEDFSRKTKKRLLIGYSRGEYA